MTIEERLAAWADEQDWNHIAENDYESMNEHYYIVSDWFDGDDLELFRQFRDHINETGRTELYNGTPFQYVEIDGWKYWLSASYYSNGLCLNRRKY